MVNFKNTIIIMTSNIGSQYIMEHAADSYEQTRTAVLAELRSHFRPEFLNRVDETVMFHSLTRENLVGIVDIQLARFSQRLAGQRMGFEASKEAKLLLANQGFDPVYGARPLKRAIQQELETPISRMIIAGELVEGQSVKAENKKGVLAFAGKK
jgi:ATP-dependent Clp protease ATP-binding subunit ClpB